jgi:hypothetical protein
MSSDVLFMESQCLDIWLRVGDLPFNRQMVMEP